MKWKTIYTIGHSTRSFEEFMEIIEAVCYDVVVDVRSKPYSRWHPQFNKNNFIQKLWSKYLWMGDSLGWFDEEISQEAFEKWIQEVLKLSISKVVVLMCSEKDKKKCHRFYKITPELMKHKAVVAHL